MAATSEKLLPQDTSMTPQKPIKSGFGFTSTAKEVLGDKDLSGKTVIVTG
jgi:hypothetical protein